MASVEPTPPDPSSGVRWRRESEVLRRAWNALVRGTGRAWTWMVSMHLFTSVALVLALFLLLIMPQTSNLLWQLPTLRGLTVGEFLLSMMFWLFVVLMVAGYLVLSWALRPVAAGEADARGLRRVRARVEGPLDAALDGSLRSVWRFRWWVLAAGAVLLWLTTRYADSLPAWWRTAGPTYFFLVMLAGLWMVLVPGSALTGEGGFVEARGSWFKLRLTGRAMVMLVITTLLGQCIWMLFENVPWMVSPRVYTMWAIFQIVFLLVTAARVVDGCHVRSDWNVRGLVALGVLGWLMVLPGQQVGRFWRLPARPATRRAEPSGAGSMPGQPLPQPDAYPAPQPSSPAVSERRARPPGEEEPDRIARRPLRRASVTSQLAVGSQSQYPLPMPSSQVPVSSQSYQPMAPTSGPAASSALSRPAQAAVLPMSETLLEIWFNAIEARLAETEPGQPVVFVAASGGGARAALFTALVLEALRNEPLTPKQISPGAPGTTAPPPSTSGRTLADQIVLISSVSGGSLASAYYVSQNYPHLRVLRDRDLPVDEQQPEGVAPRPLTRHAWHNTFPGELYARMHRRAEQMLDAARQGRGRSVSAWAGPRFEKAVERVAFECERLAEGRALADEGSPGRMPIAPWLATSAFVDDMACDFMAPLLRGVLTPGMERGVSVTRFWEDQFGWRNVEDTDLHRQPDRAMGMATNGAPVLLFNSCDVEQGSRLILGFPPLPPGLIRDPLAQPSVHLPYSLTDRGNLYYHLSLAEAVRLSANFPFGFDVGRLPLADGGELIHAVDGGVVDNSGIDSIISLLRGLDRLAKAYRRQWERIAIRYQDVYKEPAAFVDPYFVPRQKQALWDELIELSCRSLEGRSYRLLSELARRKVLLIQIDSGKKDIQATASGLSRLVAGFVPALFRPFQALNNSSYTSAELAVEDYDLALSRLEPLPTMICNCFSSRGAMPSTEQAPSKQMPTAQGQVPSKQMPTAQAAPGPDLPNLTGPPPEPLDVPSSILRVRLTCNQSANIMTAWSLGPEDKAQTVVQFLIEWLQQKPVVLKAFEIVSQVEVSTPPPGIAPPPRWATIDTKRDYSAYRRGQKLVDRARSEFYQFVSAPEAPSGMFGGTTILLDDSAREDLRNYNKLFPEEDSPPAGIPALRASDSPRSTPAPAGNRPPEGVPPAP